MSVAKYCSVVSDLSYPNTGQTVGQSMSLSRIFAPRLLEPVWGRVQRDDGNASRRGVHCYSYTCRSALLLECSADIFCLCKP